MKRFLPSILILLIIVNIFAPFSVQIDKNKLPKIIQSKAEASDVVGIALEGYTNNTDTTITAHAKVIWYIDDSRTTDVIGVLLQKNGSTDIKKTDMTVTTDSAATQSYRASHTGDPVQYTVQLGSVPLTGLDPNTNYTVTIVATQKIGFWGSPLSFITNYLTGGSNNDAAYLIFSVKTNASGDATEVTSATKNSLSLDAIMPACGIVPGSNGTIAGCAAQFLYYVVFIPTSYLFALSGQFFDFTFFYSVQDDSYKSPFVIGGWGIIRDFCNIFFIFVLLYIAFKEILGFSGGHGPNTKQLIINVIIIGLLINFSLFAAQLIIDSSNILARVFYSSNTIKITEGGANNVADFTPGLKVGPNGEIPLSAAIVNKVNPQNLIINGATNITVEDSVTGKKVTNTTITGGNLGAGAFILLVLLASFVNITGIIVFVSVGIMFIARVIGLWLAMIFAPLAFFSYTVPQMQGINMVGWKHWWPDTLKLAFLAPIFIFFLYLIIQFLDAGLGLINSSDKTGMAFIIAIVVPFIFIMILLWRAKAIAKDMSGTIGQSITGGIAAIGGLALGGAALGAAFVGRNVVGRGMAALSNTDDAKKMVKYRQDLKDFKSGKTNVAPVKPKISFISKIGDTLNRKQEKVGEVDHARHEMDSIKDKAGLKGVDDKNLSAVDVQKMQNTFTKEKKSEIETDIRKGAAPLVDGGGNPIRDTNGAIITGGESGYKSAMRSDVSHRMGLDPNNIDHGTGELTDAAKKKVEDELNVQFNAILKTSTDKESGKRFDHLRDESKEKVSGFDRMYARSNKGSYDVRNLSQTKTDKREGIFTKMGAGLIAGVAMGVRTGLKNSNINHGSGQADILKDIGHTITEALKSAQFNVKVEQSHGKSSDDHGGGHH